MACLPFNNPQPAQPAQPAFREDLVAQVRALPEPAPWIGLSAITWAGTFSSDLATQFSSAGHAELARRLDRDEVRAFCARKDVAIGFRVAVAMAWGRSNARSPRNNRALWASIPNIALLLERLPDMSRRQAFAEFRRLVGTGALRGMGPSFFTKLMFFFGCPGAYILDQWMAKSMLALLPVNWHPGAGRHPEFALSSISFVRLGYGGQSIHPAMSDSDYERYCLALEDLVLPLGRTDAADVERWLFSDPDSAWRRFLKSLGWKRKPVPA